MELISTPLEKNYLIKFKSFNDDRGSFSRAFCEDTFKKNNLETNYKQCNTSKTHFAGTLRGLHYQKDPFSEIKLIRCLNGSLFDVVVDFRKNSPTYLKWFGTILSDKNELMMYVPKGFAHGFQTLEDNTVIHYMVSEIYNAESESGINYLDPKLSINWPIDITRISEKDKSFKML